MKRLFNSIWSAVLVCVVTIFYVPVIIMTLMRGRRPSYRTFLYTVTSMCVPEFFARMPIPDPPDHEEHREAAGMKGEGSIQIDYGTGLASESLVGTMCRQLREAGFPINLHHYERKGAPEPSKKLVTQAINSALFLCGAKRFSVDEREGGLCVKFEWGE